MLIDEANITVSGGHGGAGLVSFGKMAHSGPDGGNGGDGGNYYVKAVNDITLLNQFSHETRFSAEDGYPGGKNKQNGKNGRDAVLDLPIGTTIINRATGEAILELNEEGQTELLCQGGKRGKGNYEFRGPRNTAPRHAQPGLEGERKEVKIILKLIAEYGLIGLPNSGKSSLLNEITNAKAKIGNYAFTTLSPNLAVFEGKVIADVPGLIEGAHQGKGLGIGFLKHIEKIRVLLHCISSDSKDALKDYKIVRDEMGNYNKLLLDKKEIILLTKSDLLDKKEIDMLRNKFKSVTKDILVISIYDWESIEKFKETILKY